MPGHKRKRNVFFEEVSEMDITEIRGYDNLHSPEGIIRESMDLLKHIYGTKESWYLVNGSTVGILAAIACVCRPGDKIVIARNCHKAVYNVINLLRLQVFYIFPDIQEKYDIITDFGKKEWESLREILKKEPEIRAVVVTSPTYEGVVADIKKIKYVIEKQNPNIPLIVDEAHGAHMIFHSYFPKSAVECGADLVIQSAHKTLPSLTQTALLHLCTDLVEPSKIQNMLSIFESSSPSYLLMASAEYGVMYMNEERTKIQDYVDKLQNFRTKCGQLKHIRLLDRDNLGCYDYDRGKLVFSVKDANIQGKGLFDKLLNEYHIELEMENLSYVIAMTSVMDEEKDYISLYNALKQIDNELREIGSMQKNGYVFAGKPEKVREPYECENDTCERISLLEAQDRIAAKAVMLYPPGIPLLVPGEKIVKEMVENISYYLYNGYNVLGLDHGEIVVLK